MFTGIIQEIGVVEHLRSRGESLALSVTLPRLLSQLKRGDSVAINGVCLTVSSVQGQHAQFDVMPETVQKTMLRLLRSGEAVNAEPALRVGDSLGGHWVSGHVDGVGTVSRIQPVTGYTVLTIDAPADVVRYCVVKGSITINGVSLTLIEVTSTTLTVSLIPTTLVDTILGQLKTGDFVNLEVDILGKYVYHYLHADSLAPAGGLTETFLRDHGF